MVQDTSLFRTLSVEDILLSNQDTSLVRTLSVEDIPLSNQDTSLVRTYMYLFCCESLSFTYILMENAVCNTSSECLSFMYNLTDNPDDICAHIHRTLSKAHKIILASGGANLHVHVHVYEWYYFHTSKTSANIRYLAFANIMFCVLHFQIIIDMYMYIVHV